MSATIIDKMRKERSRRSVEEDRLNGASSTAGSRLDELHVLSRQGLWGLLIFLVASAVALCFRDQTLGGLLPADLLEQLGPRPPVMLIDIVLGVSTISSLIVISGRLYHAARPGSTWNHLCFRLSFFVLYFVSDALASHMNVVFISGLAVLALQHYHLSQYTSRAMEGKTGGAGSMIR
ncbi:hypothetical protein [Geobacter sp. SVR]|uniref:hypothetical protein n=1 Tax=Geobacter sp. SVR TaxID=2495594 RepID=UPI00143F03A0|nr:hypothetical protein [Geobacter sp. SVR]BCS54439.1 hypothetical protein GSVR_27470 [Geobacter sp. SVR]GCF87671.1 hypothetical protein GSbR_42710 [Geobacter sp. SVR]